MFGVVETSDDMTSKLLGHQLFEAQRGHPGLEDLSVVFVSRKIVFEKTDRE